MAVYPLPSYPGITQEALLGQLLRKKLEPEVEDWVMQGRRMADEAGMANEETKSGMLELWSWAGMAANELARGHEWGGDFTVEEREAGVENVVTGLRRKFADEGDEDEEEDEDEMEDEDKDEDGDAGQGDDNMEIVKVESGAEGVGLKISVNQEGGGGIGIGLREMGDPLSLEQVSRFIMSGLESKT